MFKYARAPARSLCLESPASFFDFEDGIECTGCEIVWTSNVDGYLGTTSVVNGQASLKTSLMWSGARWIYAEASDSWGRKNTDSIMIITGNSKPTATIVHPTYNPVESVVAGNVYVLEGTSFDQELFTPLACSSLEWTGSAFSPSPVTGCMVPVIFGTPGIHTVTLEATDPLGKQGSVTHQVKVAPGPNSGPPYVSIVSPLGPGIPAHTFSGLLAWGNDPDDESPIDYEWVLRAPSVAFVSGIPPQDILSNQGGTMEVLIHTASGDDEQNSQLKLFLPSLLIENNGCGWLPFELEVRATDADNLQGLPDVRSYELPGNPC